MSTRRSTRLFLVTALVACAGFAVQAGAAQAEPERFTFNHVRINLGDQKGLPLIDPQVGDPHATLSGDLDAATGEFTAPPEGLSFPNKTLENFDTGPPFNLIVDVLVEFDALSQIDGTYDPATGELAVSGMDISALLTVYLDGTTPSDALGICRIEPIPLPIETQGEIVDDDGDPPTPVTFAADPFDPPARAGAAVTTWNTLPAPVAEGGTLPDVVCPALDDLLGGPGGVWLSGVDGEIQPPPPRPGGGAGPAPRAASLTVSVNPETKKAKANKKVTFTATVRNSGQLAANGTQVCVEASEKVKGSGCETLGSLAGSRSRNAEFPLKSKKKGAHDLAFTATANGAGVANDSATLKVKKKKKKKKGAIQ